MKQYPRNVFMYYKYLFHLNMVLQINNRFQRIYLILKFHLQTVCKNIELSITNKILIFQLLRNKIIFFIFLWIIEPSS